MSKKRNRITPKDCYRNLPKLSDCAVVVSQSLYRLHVFATGEQVLVSADSLDVAIYCLGFYLQSLGMDSRVIYLDETTKKCVLSAESLYSNACKNLKDVTLF